MQFDIKYIAFIVVQDTYQLIGRFVCRAKPYIRCHDQTAHSCGVERASSYMPQHASGVVFMSPAHFRKGGVRAILLGIVIAETFMRRSKC